MKAKQRVDTFRDDESGAVTVDWVVITAALVALSPSVFAAVGGGVDAANQ